MCLLMNDDDGREQLEGCAISDQKLARCSGADAIGHLVEAVTYMAMLAALRVFAVF